MDIYHDYRDNQEVIKDEYLPGLIRELNDLQDTSTIKWSKVRKDKLKLRMRFLESKIKSTQEEGITPRKLDQISKEQFFKMANPKRQPEDSYSKNEEDLWKKYRLSRRNGRNLSMLQTALELNDLQFLKLFEGDMDLQKLFSFYILNEENCLSVVEAIKDQLDLDRAIKEVDIRCNFYF